MAHHFLTPPDENIERFGASNFRIEPPFLSWCSVRPCMGITGTGTLSSFEGLHTPATTLILNYHAPGQGVQMRDFLERRQCKKIQNEDF